MEDLCLKIVNLCFFSFHFIVYNKVISSQRNVTYIQVAIGTKDKNGEVKEIRSVPKLYNGLKHHNKYFNFLTAMIQVDKGVVESIKWDDGCYTCMNCEENSVLDVDGEIELIESSSPYYQAYQGKNCYVSKSKCDSESKCDLTVYLVWSGSDAKGRVFQSANLRLSRFQSGSIENIMNAMQ